MDGVLQDPFARFFVWAAQALFGESRQGALELYQIYIRGNKPEILMLGMVILMLIAFTLQWAASPAGWTRLAAPPGR